MVSGRVFRWGIPLLIVALTWAALGGVVANGFVDYDDDLYVTANPHLTRGDVVDGVRWAFTTTRGGNWHPLTWMSHLADVRLFGLDPGAHHAVNLSLHAACAALLYALLHGLTGAPWPSALVATLFAVHPLHVESVAWVSERKDVLSTLFALAAALAYVRGVRRPAERGPRIAAPSFFALALLAKPMPLSLPLLLLALDWWPLGRWPVAHPGPSSPRTAGAGRLPPLRLLAEKLPLLALAAVSGIVTLAAQSGAGAIAPAADIPLAARLVNAAVSYAAYLWKTVWPAGLAVYYPYPWAGHPRLVVLGALAVLAGATALAARQAGRRPWLAAGWAWYVASLLPVIGIVQVGIQAMADRYTYLPLAGVFVAAAWSLAEIAAGGRGRARAVAAVAIAAVTVLGAVAARQVAVWRDGVTLFSHALASTQSNHIAHYHLGTSLLARGDAAAALPHLEETIRIAPDAGKGYRALGRALAHLGRHAEAVRSYREAVARDADDPLAHRHLAQSLERLGRTEEALASYRDAARLDPRNPRTLDLAGVALARAGAPGEALPLIEAALALDPGSASIRRHLDVVRAQLASSRTP